MPIYTYICPVCEFVEESMSSSYDEDIRVCSKCLEEAEQEVIMRRMMGNAPTIIFKTDGFYSTEKRKKVKREYEGD